jgi:hypothetical protein
MLYVLENIAGSSEMGTLDDVEYPDDTRVIELLQDVILSFDFRRLDWQQHFYCHFLFGFYVLPLEDVGVSAATHLMRNGIILQLTS